MKDWTMLGHDKNELNGVRRRPVGPEPENEDKYVHVCGECGQAFDLRSLSQVIHHDKQGHEPLAEGQLSD